MNHYSITSKQRECMSVCNGLWEGAEMRLLSWAMLAHSLHHIVPTENWLIHQFSSSSSITNHNIHPQTCTPGLLLDHRNRRRTTTTTGLLNVILAHIHALIHMCGEMNTIIITWMGCKHTPLTCEVKIAQESFTLLLASVTPAALCSQKSIHQNSRV